MELKAGIIQLKRDLEEDTSGKEHRIMPKTAGRRISGGDQHARGTGWKYSTLCQ